MDVFTLYRGLSFHLQNIIKIYLLSYGTEEVRLLKPIFQRLLEFNETNKMTATLWQYNVAHRVNEIIQGTFEMQSDFWVIDELTIAYKQSGLCTDDLETQKQISTYAETELKKYFKYRYTSLLVKHKYGTPTALLIRKKSSRIKDILGSIATIAYRDKPTYSQRNYEWELCEICEAFSKRL